MTLLWLVSAAISSAILQSELTESFDRAEAEVGRRLLSLAVDSLQETDETGAETREPHRLKFDQDSLVYQIRRGDGRILLKSHDAPTTPLTELGALGFSNTRDFRVFTLADPSSKMVIQVGELQIHRDEAIWASRLSLFLPLLLLIPLGAAAIWISTRRGLKPLDALRAEIATRDSANLTPLTVDGLPRELKPIASALSRLIDRLRSALDAERQLASNSSHELRTPIAAALAQIQRLIETTSDRKARSEARKVEATLRRLASLAEKLMQLTRADAGMAISGGPTALVPVLKLVIADSISRLRRPRDLLLEVAREAENVTVPINVDALGIVLRNLIDNAINHSSPDTPILVTVSAEGDVTLSNECPVVSPEALSRLRQRFVRGTTMASGSGLGLPIVETIIEQIGGELTLKSPRTDSAEGFEATVRFLPR